MRVALALAAALAFAAPVGAATKRVDWLRSVAATPEGGFRVGNPAARVKLVEYGSLTCSHCRDFHVAGFEVMKSRYIARGTLSYEYRSLILNAPDFAAALLARCDGAAAFFVRADRLYRSQGEWLARYSALSEDQLVPLRALPPGEAFAGIGAAIRLDNFVVDVTPARAAQCLADPAQIARLTAMRGAAGTRGVNGTPTFFVDGVVQTSGGVVDRPIITWEDLEPRLVAALNKPARGGKVAAKLR